MTVRTIGEALIAGLEAHGVDTVFGIPGNHTVELYRGLAASSIRHVTPRHEQGAAFMADGYARAGGRPGVAFVITGPGLTNAITAMAQARADSVPMLVVSGVNQRDALGKGLGFLHELPDQRGLMQKVALCSERIEAPEALHGGLARAFARMASGRPGPVHIEVPIDVMALPAVAAAASVEPATPAPPRPAPAALAEAAALMAGAARPLILAGGGARRAATPLVGLAERLGAPVVTTANGRGLLYGHPLMVPASPSLTAVRALMGDADMVLALGTELGPTDYDMYADGGFRLPERLIRVDIDDAQLQRHPAVLRILADATAAASDLLQALPAGKPSTGGEARAAAARQAAWQEIGPAMQAQVRVLEMIREALPGAILVGNSTQPVYAGNLYYDHDRPGGWFNAATGFGALGYAPPAAIGAALAAPGVPVVCLVGDGGFQFSLAEIGAAVDADVPVIFVVWNNRGYREIEVSMRERGIEPVGVSPAPPDFCRVADAYRIPAERLVALEELPAALKRARALARPALIEIMVD